jgi:hypothetical protein
MATSSPSRDGELDDTAQSAVRCARKLPAAPEATNDLAPSSLRTFHKTDLLALTLELAKHLHETGKVRFRNVGEGSGFDHGRDLRRIGRSRKCNDGHARRNLFDKPGGLDPAHSRHGQVHDHDVGLQPGDQVDGLFAIRSLPSDLEEWFG